MNKLLRPRLRGVFTISMVAIGLLAALQAQAEPKRTTVVQCKPLDSSAAESPFKPALEGQTRACGVTTKADIDVTVVAKGLKRPWAIEPLPDGRWLVNEKGGQMRIASADGKIGPAVKGVPPVDADGQGGLLDVALSPDFKNDRSVYWSFTEPRKGGNGTSVARGVLSTDGTKLEQVKVILHTRPTTTTTCTTAHD
jgi:glucose/arabinose dehydrogenase